MNALPASPDTSFGEASPVAPSATGARLARANRSRTARLLPFSRPAYKNDRRTTAAARHPASLNVWSAASPVLTKNRAVLPSCRLQAQMLIRWAAAA